MQNSNGWSTKNGLVTPIAFLQAVEKKLWFVSERVFQGSKFTMVVIFSLIPAPLHEERKKSILFSPPDKGQRFEVQ